VAILVHNLRPGVTRDLGIDPTEVCERHPRLIYCEISAFGHQGPMAGQPGYEPLVQAFSGLSSTNGGPQDPPMRSATSLCDQGAGMWLVIGALALLRQRERTGQGGVVQTSLLETALTWNAQKSDSWRNEGALPARHRSGHPGMVPYQAFTGHRDRETAASRQNGGCGARNSKRPKGKTTGPVTNLVQGFVMASSTHLARAGH